MAEIDLKKKTVQFMQAIFTDTPNAIKETTVANILVSSNQPDNVPFSKQYEGHAGLAQYVADLDRHIDRGPIEYADLYADGNTVIGLGVDKSVVRTTGKSYEMPFVHVFHYNDAGKLVKLREFNNTHRLGVAFE